MNFKNKKLSFGILYIGLIVGICIAGLLYDFSSLFKISNHQTLNIIFFILSLNIIFLPLDFLSDKALNSIKNITFKKIILGKFFLLIIFLIFSFFLITIYEKKNLLLFVFYCLISQVFLLILQGKIIKLLFKTEKFSKDSFVIKTSEEYLTFNIVFNLFKQMIIIPNHWLRNDDKNLKFHLKRFNIYLKERIYLKSICLASIINLITYSFVFYYLLEKDHDSLGFIYNFSLLSNLICFFYILTLPFISKKGILSIDKRMKNESELLFKENLEIFERNQDQNDNRSRLVEMIFYPVPSTSSRMNCDLSKGFGSPNISRLIIFLASCFLSIIFKGVHGNAGKPLNWLLPPSE